MEFPVDTEEKLSQKAKKVKYNFANGFSITEHFIQRAEERFGIKDYANPDNTPELVKNWVSNLVRNHELIEHQPTGSDIIKSNQVLLVWNGTRKQFLTCYPATYNEYESNYDDIATTIKKKSLRLDEFTKELVTDKFKEVYYEQEKDNAAELSSIYRKVSELYLKLQVCKKHSKADEIRYAINQQLSIAKELESKLRNIRSVTK